MTTVTYAETSWCADDVLEAAKEMGLSLSRRAAESLLRNGEKRITEAMIAAGWLAIDDLLLDIS